MRARLALLIFLALFTTALFGKEVFIAVSGTANNVFFSDARIFNPTDHTITIQAYYLPRGNNSNSGAQPVAFTVAAREMKIYDDVVLTLLNRGDVGAIRFVSEDDFIVTQRIYARTTGNCGTSPINPCTLGQFVQGLDKTTALVKGVLLQLKKSDNFRTNIGAVNPNDVAANVTWRLYDKNGAFVSTGTKAMPAYATIGPTGIESGFFFNAGSADLSDAWVSFQSDQPIFAYASVVDNGSTDQTYVPASPDSGTTPPDPDPEPQGKIVTVTAVSWDFTVTPSAELKRGDEVTFRITSGDGTLHGFRLIAPNGTTTLINENVISATTIERTVTLATTGTYTYFCTRDLCGEGHTSMVGTFDVEIASGPGDDY
jgi:plastocyanin